VLRIVLGFLEAKTTPIAIPSTILWIISEKTTSIPTDLVPLRVRKSQHSIFQLNLKLIFKKLCKLMLKESNFTFFIIRNFFFFFIISHFIMIVEFNSI